MGLDKLDNNIAVPNLVSNFDIIIVGGGLVGGVFALDLAMARSDVTISIIEHQDDCETISEQKLEIDNRVYAISPRNVNYIQSLGVWVDEGKVGTINQMQVYGDQDGELCFDKNQTNQFFLAKIVEYKRLQKAILNELNKLDNVSIVYDKIDSLVVDQEGVTLNSADKKSYHARLLVGADGANSFVRRASNITTPIVDYNLVGITANFKCAKNHNNTAFQWFKDGRILAFLPLFEQYISIVYSCDNVSELNELSDADFTHYIEQISHKCLGDMELVTKRAIFPLKLRLPEKLYSKNVALIGDAGHTIHPLAGQGVNLGFGDAMCLANKLKGISKSQFNDTKILEQYSNGRIFDIRLMQYTCHGILRIYASNIPLFKFVRNRGLNIVNSMSFIKKCLVKGATRY